MNNTFDQMTKANSAIMEAYAKMKHVSQYVPAHVKLTNVNETEGVKSHSFKPSQSNLDDIHDSLTKQGFVRKEGSPASGTSETRYVHPETKQIAYLGQNKHTGWLDIHQS